MNVPTVEHAAAYAAAARLNRIVNGALLIAAGLAIIAVSLFGLEAYVPMKWSLVAALFCGSAACLMVLARDIVIREIAKVTYR